MEGEKTFYSVASYCPWLAKVPPPIFKALTRSTGLIYIMKE